MKVLIVIRDGLVEEVQTPEGVEVNIIDIDPNASQPILHQVFNSGGVFDEKIKEIKDSFFEDYIDLEEYIVEQGGCPVCNMVNLNTSKTSFECLECDAGGNIVDFVMACHGVDYDQAVQKLIDYYRK